ncbi:unnamed protein product [Nippostrongylus brasiliensis]|uniref:Sodium-dependent serotonin transporter (inferred by orthology to a human protein) n=1 Tax=Nippostrongylus brasiliensis TaxID=27835 RepID=A0A158QY37_NIPBR|nr:unnamed protein product [Nippostrongylus brasiliensis]
MGDAQLTIDSAAQPQLRKHSRGLGTAAEYQPLTPAEKPVTLALRESDSIEPLGGLSPKVESRVAAMRRRSSVARDKWATKMEFLLAVIGYAVDLGNIWRFPSVCYKHGGGAFLIPYLAMLLIGGLPMFYMELALGQFHRSGCVSIWRKVCPMFKGIGYGICFICTFIACFYNAIISHAVYFVVSSIAKSTGFDDLGGVKPSMAICLAFVFLLVYFALWKGPKSSGKVWSAAATQIFFSLGPGFGVLLALSSYNDFNNNCYRDAVVTSSINCLTSFLSGFVIFSTLGYMSELTNKEVVGDHDASLIFIVYPQALATMSYSSAWSFIFFVMLITLGIDSTFAGIEALITGLCDESRLLSRKREWFVGLVCVIYYFGSLPAISYGGQYVIPFLDEYGVSLSVLFIVTCEMIAVCWFYGIDRFSNDIKSMLGFYPGIYWRICWMLCPVFISVIFVMTVWNTSLAPLQLPGYTFPKWSVGLGWFLRLLSVSSRLRWATSPQTRRISASSLSADPTQIIDSSLLHPIHTLTQV